MKTKICPNCHHPLQYIKGLDKTNWWECSNTLRCRYIKVDRNYTIDYMAIGILLFIIFVTVILIK
jgi:ssDNA-binding Zn-finger/Zn-ribbon topoisomerase 1